MTLRSTVTSVLALFGCVSLMAQSPEYDFILGTSPLLLSRNAAAIGVIPIDGMSKATLSLTGGNGEFVDIDGSRDCLNADLSAESFARISDRITFFGRLSYSYFTGKDMCGSIMMDRMYNPVAFLETSTETAGVKNRELYGLCGAMSYRLNPAWSAGFQLKYESGNNVKTRDPRYRTEWMLLDLSASMFFQPGDRLSLGASLIFRNTQESVISHLFGVSDKMYFLYIDRGGFFGTRENVSDSNAIVSTSDQQPMLNSFFGGALQFQLDGPVRFYSEIEALYRKGAYGLGISTLPIFFKYSGVELSYDGKMLISSGDDVHDLHLNAAFKHLGNAENSVKYTTNAGENTVVTYTGTKDVLSRNTISASMGYKGSMGVNGNCPSLSFGADVDASMLLQKTTVFPFYRNHNLTRVSARAFADRNFYRRKGIVSLGASVIGGAGMGTEAEDGTLASSTGSTLMSFDDLMHRQFEYDTAPYAGAGLNISYTRRLSKDLSVYVRLSDELTSMLKTPEFISGTLRNSAILTLGCNL